MNLQRIQIDKLAYGGAGVGYLEGKVCFVEGALPGEKVEIEVTHDKPRYAWAKLLKVLESSPERIDPRCTHYEICEGCQYQHLSYGEELRWKTIQVQEYLRRQTGLDELRVQSIVPSQNAYHTRMHFTAHRTQKGKLGYVAKDNRSLFELNECALLEPELERLLHESYPDGSRLTFRLTADKKIVRSGQHELYEVEVGDRKVWAHSDAFFQANRSVAVEIGKTLASILEPLEIKSFADLYAGCGLFSLLAAARVPKIFLAESSNASFLALEKNFENAPQEVIAAQGDAGELFMDWFARERPQNTAIFLDPPRCGLDKKFAKALAKIEKQPVLCYLSCHLGSLTRDLGVILARGRWEIDRVIPFDMFPRTKHIEILTVLKPRSQ